MDTSEPAVASGNLQAARRLYAALRAQDPGAVLSALTPRFRGVVSDGMPAGLGGTYEGPETMLRDCWARVFAMLDIRPVPAEYLPISADRMIVLGHYEGTARSTGRQLSAAFAHILRFADGRVSELAQLTDTARWHDALAQ